MNDDETYSDINFANYKLLFNIYECEYDAKNKSKSLLVLIKKILEDILKSNGGDLSRVGDIMSKIMDRPSFNKELALLQR
jgi:hypothetical protein